MSFAPRDSHEAQVQFALERGVPAFIGVLGSVKLPFPSSSFDMAHCSHCLIPWSGNGEAALDRSPVQCSPVRLYTHAIVMRLIDKVPMQAGCT
jgi:hypothetical protein